MLKAKLYVTITIILWIVFGAIIKLISNSNTFTIITISLFAASIVNYLYFRSRSNGETSFKYNKKFIFFSLFGYFFYWLFFLLSIEYYDEMIAPPVILNYTWPFFTGLITVWFYKKEQPSLVFYITLLLGFLGIVVLASKGSIENLHFSYSITGLLFGLLTGFSFGVFSSFSSTIESEYENAVFLLTGSTLSFIFLGIVSFIKYGNDMFDLSFMDWVLAFFIGFFLDSIGYILWTRAQSIVREKELNISAILNLVYFLPIFSILLIGVLFEGERDLIVKPYFIIATVLILSSSIILRVSEK